MAAQPLSSAVLDRNGFVGDRRYALRRLDDGSGFPWHTAGKLPALVRYSIETLDARGRPTRIRLPDGGVLACDGSSISEYFRATHGLNVELMHLTQGMFDCAGVSIITRQTLASLESLTQSVLDVRRFRPNIVIDADGSPGAYPENEWIGRTIAFGDPADGPRMAATELDERCSMINIDPETGGITPELLRSIVQHVGNYAGIYATPTRTGTCAIGDLVYTAAT